jgi:hypothetical protein
MEIMCTGLKLRPITVSPVMRLSYQANARLLGYSHPICQVPEIGTHLLSHSPVAGFSGSPVCFFHSMQLVQIDPLEQKSQENIYRFLANA